MYCIASGKWNASRLTPGLFLDIYCFRISILSDEFNNGKVMSLVFQFWCCGVCVKNECDVVGVRADCLILFHVFFSWGRGDTFCPIGCAIITSGQDEIIYYCFWFYSRMEDTRWVQDFFFLFLLLMKEMRRQYELQPFLCVSRDGKILFYNSRSC